MSFENQRHGLDVSNTLGLRRRSSCRQVPRSPDIDRSSCSPLLISIERNALTLFCFKIGATRGGQNISMKSSRRVPSSQGSMFWILSSSSSLVISRSVVPATLTTSFSSSTNIAIKTEPWTSEGWFRCTPANQLVTTWCKKDKEEYHRH